MTDRLPLFVAPAVVAEGDARAALRLDVGNETVFAEGRLPGARRVDFSALVRKDGEAGGMMPAPDVLAATLSRLGMRDDTPVVVYDRDGGGRACRLVWCLHVMGFTRASVIDGGLDAWKADGFDVEAGEGAASFDAGDLSVRPDPARLVDKATVLAGLADDDFQLLDTRTPGEFAGTDVRAARGGHIPGALHWDWVNAHDGSPERRLRPADELRDELLALGLRPEARVAAYCQTHHRSSHTYVLLRHLGFERACGYAGAWSEWGNDPQTPIA